MIDCCRPCCAHAVALLDLRYYERALAIDPLYHSMQQHPLEEGQCAPSESDDAEAVGAGVS